MLACLVSVAWLAPGCLLNRYRVDGPEAQRAAREARTAPEVIVAAHEELEDRPVRLRLRQSDEVDVTTRAPDTDALVGPTEMRLHEAAPLSDRVVMLRWDQRTWAPVVITAGVVTTVSAYLFSTFIATQSGEMFYAIPVVGPISWMHDVVEGCDSLPCIFLVPFAVLFGLGITAGHVAGPLMVVAGLYADPPSREVGPTPFALGLRGTFP